MSGRSIVSTFTIFVLIVGLVVGGGGIYYLTSGQYRPRIKNQESQIEVLSSQIQSLTARVDSLEAENASLVSEVLGYEEAVSALNEQVSDLEGLISVYETTISGLEAQIESLLAQEDELPDLIDDYEEMISELEERIDLYRSTLESYLPETIRIGITASGVISLEVVQAVVNITQEEINAFCVEEDFPHRFEFVVLNNRDSATEAVANTIWLNSEGINLIVGHPRSQDSSLALDYVDTHDMMMLSSSASSRGLSISDDNFFRTCPSELYQAAVIAEALDRLGIEAIVVVQRDDDWGEDFYYALSDEFEARGGVVYERVLYDPEDTRFMSELNSVEAAVQSAIEEYGSGDVAVQVIGSNEVSSLIDHTGAFSALYGVTWFGTGKIANSTEVFEDVAEEAAQLRLLSPVPIPDDNPKYIAFTEEYRSRMGTKPGFDASALYDACWLYALTILEVWTTDTGLVKQKLPEIAESYTGASGLCLLNDEGDREVVDFEIWGYMLEGDEVSTRNYGYYDASEERVTWT